MTKLKIMDSAPPPPKYGEGIARIYQAIREMSLNERLSFEALDDKTIQKVRTNISHANKRGAYGNAVRVTTEIERNPDGSTTLHIWKLEKVELNVQLVRKMIDDYDAGRLEPGIYPPWQAIARALLPLAEGKRK